MTSSPPQRSVAGSQRDAVLRNAARLFRIKGYERTTVRELADAVGLKSASLFHYFATKPEILAAVMEEGLALAAENIARAIEQGSTPRERLEACFRYYLIGLLSEEYRDYMTCLLYDFRSLPPELAQRVHRYRSSLERYWQSVLDDAIAPEQRAGSRLTGQFIFGAMCWALQWYNPKGKLELDALSRRFADIAFAACGVEPPERDDSVDSHGSVAACAREHAVSQVGGEEVRNDAGLHPATENRRR